MVVHRSYAAAVQCLPRIEQLSVAVALFSTKITVVAFRATLIGVAEINNSVPAGLASPKARGLGLVFRFLDPVS